MHTTTFDENDVGRYWSFN